MSLLLAFGFILMSGIGPGMGIFLPSRSLLRHQPFHILGLRGLDLVAAGSVEEDARIAKR